MWRGRLTLHAPKTGVQGFTAAVRPPPPVWGLMGCPGRYPTADRQGPQGVQQERHSAQGKLPAESNTHPPISMPSPPRKCLVASSRPAHQTCRLAAGTGACFSNTTTTRRPSHIFCLTFLTKANCSCATLV